MFVIIETVVTATKKERTSTVLSFLKISPVRGEIMLFF